MAHYIAELIARAESKTGEEKQKDRKECFEAILTLWKHINDLPYGNRPFEDLEPIVRAISSLDPDDDTPRYFRSINLPQGQEEEKSERDRWLDLVGSTDYSAKILIGYFLGEAARVAIDKTQEWVKLAKAAGTEEDAYEVVIHFVSTNADLGREPDSNAEVRQQLKDRIRRLEIFVKLADSVAGDLKKRLDALPSIKKKDD